MFEALVPSEVEHQLHGHYLAVGHGRLAAATLLARGREKVFLKLGVEIFAEFVHGTENFINYVVGNHKDCIFIIILIYNYKDTNFLMITFSFSDKVINKVIPNSRIAMEAIPAILQMKYARIVKSFAERAGLSYEEALNKFYDSKTFELISNGIADMHCMSDDYLTDELLIELGLLKTAHPAQP